VLTQQSLLLSAAIGAVAGAQMFIGEVYEDSIYQRFRVRRLAMRAVLGGIVAVQIQGRLLLPLTDVAAVILLFGLTYAVEWGMMAAWKSLVRGNAPSALSASRTFETSAGWTSNAALRIPVAVGSVTALALSLLALAQLDRSGVGPPTIGTSAFAGFGVGMIIAIGGAWKEFPKEGFEMLKFLRSPSMILVLSLGLSFLTDSYLYLAVAAIGYQRAALDIWKALLGHLASKLRTGRWV
jgi:hypothetical protein